MGTQETLERDGDSRFKDRVARRAFAEEIARKHGVDAGDVGTSCPTSCCRRSSDCRRASSVPASEESPLGKQELALLLALTKAGVPFLVVGASAAVMQGADVGTQDLALWFQSTAHPGLAQAIERVLASKKAANRPKDLAAIPALEAAIAALEESARRR